MTDGPGVITEQGEREVKGDEELIGELQTSHCHNASDDNNRAFFVLAVSFDGNRFLAGYHERVRLRGVQFSVSPNVSDDFLKRALLGSGSRTAAAGGGLA